jgi:streptogramin lyase
MITPRALLLHVTAIATGVALALAPLAAPAAWAVPVTAPIATVNLPSGFYDLEPGLGAMWAMTNDESTYSTIYRIDPRTNVVTERIPLGYPAAFLTLGYGSLWVSDYYGSHLIRYSATGSLQATIPVGLQPQFVHIAFGSVWTSNHHGHSLSRIDPNSNGVIATVQVGARVFRNGPQEMVSSSRYLYVGSSNLTYLQRVDPTDNHVTNLADTGKVCCGDLLYTPGRLGGTIWDLGPKSLAARDLLGGTRLRIPADDGDTLTTEADLDGLLWYGENGAGRSGRLRVVDDQTGAPVMDIVFDGRAGTLAAGFGSVWNVDWRTGRLQRFASGAAT